MKILFWGVSPYIKSAYGIQGKQMVRLFKRLGHEVTFLCYAGFYGHTDFEGCDMYGAISQGINLVPTLAQGKDLLLRFGDLWMLPISFVPHKFYDYSPTDSDPASRKIATMIRRCEGIIHMSHFHERMVKQAGLKAGTYIPHWVDDEVFKPMNQTACRKKLGWDKDSLIFGVNATNNSWRKNWPGMISAFADYHQLHKDSKLAMFTYVYNDHMNPDGQPLDELLAYYNLEDGRDVYVVNQMALLAGIPEEELAIWYNGLDVLMLCSMGEGFGIPVAEAALCKVPSIVSDSTAMPEVAGEGGVKVPVTENFINNLNRSIMKYPTTEAILRAMTYAGQSYKDLREPAYAHAKANYTAKVVEPLWEKFLSGVSTGAKD